jgi:hypothetical protein
LQCSELAYAIDSAMPGATLRIGEAIRAAPSAATAVEAAARQVVPRARTAGSASLAQARIHAIWRFVLVEPERIRVRSARRLRCSNSWCGWIRRASGYETSQEEQCEMTLPHLTITISPH